MSRADDILLPHLLFATKASYYRHNLPDSLEESWCYYLRQDLMNTENYLNHPTFGLLSRVCGLEQHQELFTTLYAQRLFFLVTSEPPGGGMKFESVTRSQARLLLETRLRLLRRSGQYQEYEQLQKILQSTFQ